MDKVCFRHCSYTNLMYYVLRRLHLFSLTYIHINNLLGKIKQLREIQETENKHTFAQLNDRGAQMGSARIMNNPLG